MLLIAAGPVAVADQQNEAMVWIEKMSTALREQNYEGVFNFIRGKEFNTMRISHVFKDGHEHERILQLNGERRDIVRVDDEVFCHHDGNHHTDLEHNVPLGPFSSKFNEDINAVKDFYQFTVHGEDRVANRATVRIAIQPKFQDRFGYRLWLDKETGLLLQSHLVDRTRVKEVFQFATLSIGEPIAAESLLAVTDSATVTHQLMADVIETAERPTLKVSWLPDGFRPKQVTANRLHFTDGLATFSVFIERSRRMPELQTQMGGTAVITRSLRDNLGQITVVGEVPIATARKVAESVEPVLY